MTVKPPVSPLHAILAAYQRPFAEGVAATRDDAGRAAPSREPLRRTGSAGASAGAFRDPLQDPRYRTQIRSRPAIASSELLAAMISQMGGEGLTETYTKGRHVDVFV